jgi:CMP-N,N'-diacetyllegionaminic acid synthase
MILALIPARAGSKRVPGKNKRPLAGRPLVEYTISAALQAQYVDKVVVSTDDLEILEIASNYPGVIGHRRSGEASTDDATDGDVIMDYLRSGRNPDDILEDIQLIVYLRPTTPLRRVEWIDKAIVLINEVPAATGLRSVHEMSESAYKCFEISYGQILQRMPGMGSVDNIDGANLPNHFYPKTYHPNGAVDIIRPEVMQFNRLFGDKVMAYVTPPTIEIDTEHDFRLAEWELAMDEGGERIVFK